MLTKRLQIMFDVAPFLTDFEKISDPRLQPHHELVAPDSEDECVSNADSYVETEVDSSLEQDAFEPTQSQPSRLHQAVRTEVRLRRLSIPLSLLQNLHSGHHGKS